MHPWPTDVSAEPVFPSYAEGLPEEHPVRLYFIESHYLRVVIKDLNDCSPVQDPQRFFSVFNQLCEVEKRFARKENQLFPFLEKRGWFGPSQGMWSLHDEIREMIRCVRKTIETREMVDLKTETRLLLEELLRLMAIEEMRLFPNAMSLLTEEDWLEMQRGESEIGWMLPTKSRASIESSGSAGASPAELSQGRPDAEGVALKPQPDVSPRDSSASASSGVSRDLPFAIEGRIRMDEGWLLPEQLNLMLKFLPVDLTYVDENDRVLFYNRGETRVFPRSAGVIGREVRFCHPPKSVATVLRILEAFRSAEKDEAEFWIRHRGRVLHIRYFAVRDQDKRYKGVIEVSQDITDIQKLEGERRLLNWDEES